ncbi:hypothetical protein vseg_014824 [Gypsophila vaccaria]
MCPTGTTLNPVAVDATSDFRGAFAVMDVDRDGKISGDDLRSFYATVSSKNPNPHDDAVIRAMISVADANKDGYVQYDEFKGVLDVREGANNDNDNDNDNNNKEEVVIMREVFRVMDSDGDGRLGVDDLRHYLELIGINVNDDEEIKVMIKLGGGNVSDGVSFHGFLNILALR